MDRPLCKGAPVAVVRLLADQGGKVKGLIVLVGLRARVTEEALLV